MTKKRRPSGTRGRKRTEQAQRLAAIRYGVLGGGALVVGVVLIWGLLYSTGVGEGGEILEGDHYRTVENSPRRRPGDPIVVTEFFSYGCVHCRNFDPLIEDWRQELAAGLVFERAPVAFSAEWAVLGQAYLALLEAGALEANHERIFRVIHDNGRTFLTANQVADFVEGNGVTRQEFLDAYNSPSVRRTLARIEARQRKLGISSVPTLVVADTYVVNMEVGRRRSLEVADALAALIRAEAPNGDQEAQPTERPSN